MNPFKRNKKKEEVRIEPKEKVRKPKAKKKSLKFDEELQNWLGSELVREGNELLNNSPTKAKIISMYLVAKKNWLLSIGEIKDLEVKLKIATKEEGYRP